MHLWARREMMLAWARVVSEERDVGGFEVYFIGLGNQWGGWGCILLTGYEEVLRQKSKVFRSLKCGM